MYKMRIVILMSLLVLPINVVFAKDLHFFTATGETIIPDSSQPHRGKNIMTTNIIVTKPFTLSSSGLPNGETPASLACVYGLTKPVVGCRKNVATELPSGGWGAIALVDAYYNPYAASDLNTFSRQFGLPDCTTANGCFHQVYATGTQPSQGWWDEQVLDIEMAHAMAPNAKIYLVEAASDSIDDLLFAEDVASSLVAPTGGIVSNSWGDLEFAGETALDSHFTQPGIVYLASSGDYGAPARYPSSSPNIISAGGTAIQRDSSGNLIGESAWSRSPNSPAGQKSGSSGGPSVYESRPDFQNIIQKIVGTQRGTPDISFDADPNTGVLIYSTYSNGWIVDGGTSVSSPALAGIINSANQRASSSHDELMYIYQNYPKNYHQYWHDILSGNNGQYLSISGYDFVTGLGSPLSYVGK